MLGLPESRGYPSKVIFIVDGLTSIPAERQLARDAILDLIPFGYPQFKFIFSGPSETLSRLSALRTLIFKTFQVPPFAREEARALFEPGISADFIDEIYKVCKGLPGYLATVQRLLRNGMTTEQLVRTARKMNKDEDLFRFGVQSSTVAELNGFDVSRSEIEARMALGQAAASEALAQGSVLKEDRLRLLAVVGRKKKELGIPLEPEFLLQLEKIFYEVDWDYLSRHASQLAGDLIYSRPDLATKALEKGAAAKSSSGKEKQLDWALASLTLQAEGSPNLDSSGRENLRQQIKDPQIQQFSRAVSALVKNLSSEEIIREIDGLSDAAEKLFLLRQWTVNVLNPENVGNIIEFALNLGIQTTEYAPSATHLRELATGIQHVGSQSMIESLLRMFDAQRATVERLGPTLDYIRLQLLLARAEAKISFSECSNRLIDAYLYVEAITELSTRCSSLAYFMSGLVDIDPDKTLETAYQLHSRVSTDFHDGLRRLLEDSADHEFVTRNILDALANTHTDLAVSVAMSLNIEYRRDASLGSLILAMLKPRLRNIKFEALPKIIGKFSDRSERARATETTPRWVF
jgi:hypothetical protein